MTADTQAQGDLVALARKCGAGISQPNAYVNLFSLHFTPEQFEAFAAAIRSPADTVDMRNAMGEPLYLNSTSLLLLYRAFRALAAHPKPAAPATAEDMKVYNAIADNYFAATADVSEIATKLQLFRAKHGEHWSIDENELIVECFHALRSGASAQPAEGGADRG